MEAGVRTVQRIGSCAKLLDEFGRPDHGFENCAQERAIPAYTINIGGDPDKFALCVEFDIASITPVDRPIHVEDRRHHAVLVDAFGIPDYVGLGLFNQTGPEQSERLRGAVANPDAVVIARTRLEGGSRGVNEDERSLAPRPCR